MRKSLFSLLFCLISNITFGQNSLNDYIQAAIKFSPVSIDNQNQKNSLAFDSMLIRSGMKPQVNFTSNNYYAPVVDGFGYDEIITNKGNYNALVGVNYTITGKNNRNNQYAALDIQKQILELNTKLNERDLRQSVTSQYISVYTGQQLLLNAEKILDVLKKEDEILKKSTEKGTYAQVDYLTFLVNYKQQKLAYSQQKLQAQNDLFLLNYLCGISDTNFVMVSDPDLKVMPASPVVQTSPYQQFLLDSLSLQNTIEKLKFNYKPKINLTGDAGYNTSFYYHPERNFGLSAGLNVLIPIYDGHQRKLELNKLKLTDNVRLNHIEYFKKQYDIKASQLIKQIGETGNLIFEADEQLKLSETLLKANNQLLETGEANISDYILSLTNYISSKTLIQQLTNDKMQLINQYNFLNN